MLKNRTKLKIGFLTPGFEAYWGQMPGIKEEIESYAYKIATRLQTYGEVVNAGMVDNIVKARTTDELLYRENVDVVFVHVGTYAPSKNILRAIHRIKVPIILLHLQPVDNFTIQTQSIYTLPKNTFSAGGEIGNVFRRSGVKFNCIVGRLDRDERVWQEIKEWCDAIYVKKALRYSNLGLLGNFYPGMCDLYVDIAMMTAKFGVHVELSEIGQLKQYVEQVSDEEIFTNYQKTKEAFDFVGEIGVEKLKWCNQVAVGMEKFVKSLDLQGLAFHFGGYPDSMEEKIGYSMTLGGSLLTAKGVPCLAEGDILLGVAMLAMGYFSGGASQSEINVGDYVSNCSYVGHAGPGDITLAQGRPLLRWLDFFHGKKGNGVSCEFSLKQGPVTLVSLVQNESGKFKIIVTEAEAIAGERLKNGNVNTRIRFNAPIQEFFSKWVAEGPSHHSVMSLGRHADKLKKLAQVIEIEYIQI